MATKRSTPNEYESPPLPQPNTGETSSSVSEFESPEGEFALAADAAEAEAESYLTGVDSQLLAAKSEIEKLLGHLAAQTDGPVSQAAMDANIVGVGIGLGSGESGGIPGEPVLEVYTIEKQSPADMQAKLASAVGVSALASSDFPIHMVQTGIVDAFQHRMRLRPAPGGISVGHVRITAGTLGCLSRGRSAPRNSRLMVLSNNHVLANSNVASLGDPILQAGPADGGRMPADQIAVLERFVPINFAGGNNLVDCATGWAWPDRVRPELMYISGGVIRYFRVGGVPVAAVPGLNVGKTGRTTQLTSGRVTAIGVTVNVNYGGGRVARFVNQMAVRAGAGDFSQGGDSGSLIWTWDSRRAPVGLLFAGGGGTTFANRIGDVLNALDINLVT
ncbi:hypothetical protein [Paucibacter sp. XJ19-41]|uniref:hypothetical protein n=1 Tax=Paucibacter sp. XJ19-41 TaxID=2927824 RepID=UPI00234B00FD|nr:hypothetical protein [Paucibacter sp. XJ19-41]MDC6169364.1 hypothetical protein [Paucibacter sp. XJ19-41]